MWAVPAEPRNLNWDHDMLGRFLFLTIVSDSTFSAEPDG